HRPALPLQPVRRAGARRRRVHADEGDFAAQPRAHGGGDLLSLPARDEGVARRRDLARVGLSLRGKAAALALLLAPAPAFAQAYQCRVPEAAPTVPPIARDGTERRAPLAGYTLALSWSPEFCRFRADSSA